MPLPPRLDIFRNQSYGHIEENFVNADEGGGENVDEHVVNESGEENVVNEDVVHQDATNDNTDESPSIRTRPSSPTPSGHRTESRGKTVRSPDLVNKAESTFVGRFGDLPFASQWGLTESSWMNTTLNCRDMLSNRFTPADYEFFNEGVSDHTTLQISWRQLGQYVKLCYDESKKELVQLCMKYEEKVPAHVLLLRDYDHALDVEKDLQDRVREIEEEKKEWLVVEENQVKQIKKLEDDLAKFDKDAHQLRKEKEDLAMKGVSVGRYEEAVNAMIDGIDGLDPEASSKLMEKYDALFNRRYSYVDKVANAYRLSPSDLHNVLPDESGPTPDQGPLPSS
ncbi:hypothetical protein Tco_1291166 [Tanacetum coccineum]